MRLPRLAVCTLVFSASFYLATLTAAQAATRTSTPAPDPLTLEQALDRAARNRPELSAFGADLDAAGLKLNHAGLPPNPEMGIEWDNLGGNLPDGDSRETTISLSQPVEIGGKPLARKKKGQAELQQLHSGRTVAWLEIAVEVRLAFLEVQNARERLALQGEAGKIAAQLAEITHEQVAAGKIAGTEETRAEARKAETAAETQKLKRLLAEAELNLAVVLGEPGTAGVTAKERLTREVPIPDRQTLLAAVKDAPLLALRRSETRLAASSLSLEQTKAWPDPTVSVAVREDAREDARAVALGISLPLPLFQRNQAAVAEAGALARKATANEASAARSLQTELIKAHTVLVSADQEARTLQTEVLSKATEAAEATQEGFRAGKFRYSEVLDASQFLMTVKGRYLDALLDLNRAAIALDRLRGLPAFIPGAGVSKQPAPSTLHRSTP